MIFFVNGNGDVRVIRRDDDSGKVENIGRFVKEKKWLWDQTAGTGRRSWLYYETFTGAEKRDIIGLLDKMNGIDDRPITEALEQWYRTSKLTPI